ncbi:MAG: hypothetical protein JWM57_3937 [Phycisphaerales bacterium]|nr:hypothetical protein [Phycisphaerales bacterium]
MSWKASVLAVALAAAVCPTLSFAQNDPNAAGGGGNNGGGRQRGQGGQGGQGGGGQGGGRMDPAQFQQQMMDRMKEQLKVQDDEWRVIEPKLTKVVAAQREARAGMMGGFGGRGGRGGGGGGPGGGGGGGQDQTPTTKIGIAQKDLRTALESDACSPEDIDKKLTAYRAAKAEVQTSLDAARKDLKEVLTAKQEAQLVLMGMLE